MEAEMQQSKTTATTTCSSRSKDGSTTSKMDEFSEIEFGDGPSVPLLPRTGRGIPNLTTVFSLDPWVALSANTQPLSISLQQSSPKLAEVAREPLFLLEMVFAGQKFQFLLPETEEEKQLKEEIRALEEVVKKTDDNNGGKIANGNRHRVDAEQMENLRAQLAQKDKQLEELTLALDDKIRFPQRSVSRPVSSSGRLDSDIGSESGKQGSRSERMNIPRGYSPERPRSLSGHRTLNINDGEWASGVSSRTGDFAQILERERQGSLSGHADMVLSQNIRGYNCLNGRGFGFDNLGSQSGRADFARCFDDDRRGSRSANALRFQDNCSERPGFQSGHIDAIQRYDSDRSSSHYGNRHIHQGYDFEKLDSGHWNSYVRGGETGRQSYNLGNSGIIRGYESGRSGSQLGHRSIFRGYGIDRSGPCNGFDEDQMNSGGYERPGSLSRRIDSLRPREAEWLGSQPGHVEGERYKAFDERICLSSGNGNARRFNKTEGPLSIYESGRTGPLSGRADIGRNDVPHRGAVSSRSGDEQDSNRREYNGMQQHHRRGKDYMPQYDRQSNEYNGMQQYDRRGREYDGMQQYYPRGDSHKDNKFVYNKVGCSSSPGKTLQPSWFAGIFLVSWHIVSSATDDTKQSDVNIFAKLSVFWELSHVMSLVFPTVVEKGALGIAKAFYIHPLSPGLHTQGASRPGCAGAGLGAPPTALGAPQCTEAHQGATYTGPYLLWWLLIWCTLRDELSHVPPQRGPVGSCSVIRSMLKIILGSSLNAFQVNLDGDPSCSIDSVDYSRSLVGQAARSCSNHLVCIQKLLG
eukprot:Gb_05083 [translate_table: standard]